MVSKNFRQDGVPSDIGCVAPLSLGIVGQDPSCAAAAFFLGNDGIIYQIANGVVKAVSYETLADVIPSTASLR